MPSLLYTAAHPDDDTFGEVGRPPRRRSRLPLDGVHSTNGDEAMSPPVPDSFRFEP